MQTYFEKIYAKGQKQFEMLLDDRLEKEEKTFIITANPETLMIGKSNREFDRILCSDKTIVTPDGIGVVKGAGMLNYPIQERVTGVDIVKYLFKILNETGRSLYLFGAKPEVVKALADKIGTEYPRIVLSGYADGYVKDKDKVFEDIAEKQPDVVLVALGIPAQELLIQKHYDKFTKGIFVGVGGSFDVLSGMKKRAPRFFVRHNLEWLYRICSEPKRIKRFYKSNIKYLSEIKKMRKGMSK